MSDWRTLKQAILEEADKPNDAELVERSLCEALRFLRAIRFWWNEDVATLTTIADQYEYDLPTDFLAMIGKCYYIDAGDTSSKRVMYEKTVDWMEDYKYDGFDWESMIMSGPPQFYSIRESKMLLLPVPTESGDSVEFRYIKDLGTPIEKYNGTAWTVYAADGVTTLPATTTNAWFTTGRDLLKHRALYVLYDNFYKDEALASKHMQKYLETLQRLRGQFTRRRATRSVRPWL